MRRVGDWLPLAFAVGLIVAALAIGLVRTCGGF